MSFAADVQMSGVDAGEILSAREVLIPLLSSFNHSTTSSDACNGIVVKGMLIKRITIFDIIT